MTRPKIGFLFDVDGTLTTYHANDSVIDLLLISDQFNENVFDNLKLYSKINIKYPLIETHPYPTKYYYEGDAFIKEISKDGIEILSPTPNMR